MHWIINLIEIIFIAIYLTVATYILNHFNFPSFPFLLKIKSFQIKLEKKNSTFCYKNNGRFLQDDIHFVI